jgi:hypothetical protein
VATYFDDSTGELTTLRTSSMKGGGGGNFSPNKSDLNKNNIIKPIFDILTDENRKALESYRANLDELFYLLDEVTR